MTGLYHEPCFVEHGESWERFKEISNENGGKHLLIEFLGRFKRLVHSLTYSFTHCLNHVLFWLSFYSFTCSLFHWIWLFDHFIVHILSDWFIHSVANPLTNLFAHSLTHSPLIRFIFWSFIYCLCLRSYLFTAYILRLISFRFICWRLCLLLCLFAPKQHL